MIRRLRRAASQIVPFLLIILLVLGNTFARVFISPDVVGYIALIAAASLGAALWSARKPITVPPVIRALAGLWLVMLIATFFAIDREYAAVETILWVSVIAIFWASTFMDAQRIERVVFAVLAALAILAILQAVWSLTQSGFAAIPRSPAATPNPNNVGAAMLPAMALALWRKRWFWLGVFFLALIVSGARAALGGLVIGALIYGLSHFVGARHALPLQNDPHPLRIPARWLLLGGLALLILIPIFASQMIHPTHGTLALRLDIWQAAGRAFLDDPLTGIGPQNYEYAFTEYKQLTHETLHQHAHNIVLEAAATTGILGLLALIALAVVLIRRIVLVHRSGDRRRAVLLASLFVALLAQGMIEYVYWVAASTWVVMLTGWTLAHIPDVPHTVTRRERIGTAALWLAGLMLIFVLPLEAWQPFLLCIGLAFGVYVTGLQQS